MEGNVDPVRDIEIIHEELRLKDEEMIGPIIDKLEKTAVRGGDKKLKPEYVSRVFVSAHECFSCPISHSDILSLLLSRYTPGNTPSLALGYHNQDKELGFR